MEASTSAAFTLEIQIQRLQIQHFPNFNEFFQFCAFFSSIHFEVGPRTLCKSVPKSSSHSDARRRFLQASEGQSSKPTCDSLLLEVLDELLGLVVLLLQRLVLRLRLLQVLVDGVAQRLRLDPVALQLQHPLLVLLDAGLQLALLLLPALLLPLHRRQLDGMVGGSGGARGRGGGEGRDHVMERAGWELESVCLLKFADIIIMNSKPKH